MDEKNGAMQGAAGSMMSNLSFGRSLYFSSAFLTICSKMEPGVFFESIEDAPTFHIVLRPGARFISGFSGDETPFSWLGPTSAEADDALWRVSIMRGWEVVKSAKSILKRFVLSFEQLTNRPL